MFKRLLPCIVAASLVACDRPTAPSVLPDARDLLTSQTAADALSGYTTVDLGALDQVSSSYALGINNCGQIVGGNDRRSPFQRSALLWENGVLRDLGIDQGAVAAINDAGQMVGQSANGGFFWDDGAITSYLPDMGGGVTRVFPQDVNNAGRVAGFGYVNNSDRHAFVWEDGALADLGTIGGIASIAEGINQPGQVVGTMWLSTGRNRRAFLWDDGAVTMFPLLDGYESVGSDVDDAGRVVGSITTGSGVSAVLWEDGGGTKLGAPWATQTGAMAINNVGQVFGWARVAGGSMRAFLWEAGVMTDIGLLPGAVSAQPFAANDFGQVVGTNTFWDYDDEGNRTSRNRATLWQPPVVGALPPVATVGADAVVVLGQPADLDASGSTDPCGLSLTYLWALGDGGSATGQRISYVYATFGTFVATLTVTNQRGASATDDVSITVLAPPVADAGPDQAVLVTLPVEFDASGSSDADGAIVAYAWDFGDGSPTAPGQAVSYAYPVAGTFTVTLTVTDDDGLWSQDQTNVWVQTPSEAVDALIEDVNEAARDNDLSPKDTEKLLRPLVEAKDALAKFDEGMLQTTRPAINQLRDFIERVEHAVSKQKLDAADGQPLIEAAQAISGVLEAM